MPLTPKLERVVRQAESFLLRPKAWRRLCAKARDLIVQARSPEVIQAYRNASAQSMEFRRNPGGVPRQK